MTAREIDRTARAMLAGAAKDQKQGTDGMSSDERRLASQRRYDERRRAAKREAVRG